MTEAEFESVVMESTEVVTDYERCAKILTDIQNSPNPMVGFDCEGLNVGVNGIITLAQIGLPNGRAFIFDMLQGPRLFTLGGLKDFLESRSVLKVMHDCRGDSVNLRHQFAVRLDHVFDTQAAYTVLQLQETGDPIARIKHLGLRDMCQKYNARFALAKKDKSVYRGGELQYWERRPLTQKQIVYAALDVLCLVPEVHNCMERQILPELKFMIDELSMEQSLMNIEGEVDKYREKLKRIHHDQLEELERKIIGAAEAQKRIVLSFQEIALLRHLELPTEIKEHLRRYYTQPKLKR